jgi:GntR family transcriptional regulator
MDKALQSTSLAYLRAQETILRMVEGPDYAPGDKIPSERALSVSFGISRMTVRKAIENLVRLGVLERRSTSGTHVATPNVTRPLDPYVVFSISQMVANTGGVPGSTLLSFNSAVASCKMAEHLQIESGAPLIVIRRLRTANGVPFCVETSYLPADRVPGLAASDLNARASLYAILRNRYGIEIGDRRGIISVAPLGVEDAVLFELNPDCNVLIYRSDLFDQHHRLVEHLVSVNHPQRVVFATESVRVSAVGHENSDDRAPSPQQ